MAEHIKSGQELIDDFMKEVASIDGVDENVANAVANLYQEGKLTLTNLSNELLKIREG